MIKLDFNIIKVSEFHHLHGDKNQTLLIESNEDLKELRVLLDPVVTDEFFFENSLVGVVFHDGSVPKRFVKEVLFYETKKTVMIVTNLKDITFSSMDLRMHFFLLSVRIKGINKVTYE